MRFQSQSYQIHLATRVNKRVMLDSEPIVLVESNIVLSGTTE